VSSTNAKQSAIRYVNIKEINPYGETINNRMIKNLRFVKYWTRWVFVNIRLHLFFRENLNEAIQI
jgi:hypothetical protein